MNGQHSDNTKKQLPVLISGAGPVGLLSALRLAQAGINVVVLEREPALNDLPRATGYFGASLLTFQKAGVLEKIRQRGFAAAGICWRKPLKDDGNGGKALGDMVASLPLAADDTPGNITGTICLAQSKLTKLLFEEVLATGRVVVHFNSEITGVENGEESVNAFVKSTIPGAPNSYEGSFLIGADGASSAVRKSLGISLKGHTWPDRLIAIDVYVETPPFEENISTHMIIDPIHYGLTTPIDPPILGKRSLHRWSVATAPDDPRSDEELESDESVFELLEKFIPGPRPLKAELSRASTYKLHQRCAGTMRRGRCLLAGDAAHINNVSETFCFSVKI